MSEFKKITHPYYVRLVNIIRPVNKMVAPTIQYTYIYVEAETTTEVQAHILSAAFPVQNKRVGIVVLTRDFLQQQLNKIESEISQHPIDNISKTLNPKWQIKA